MTGCDVVRPPGCWYFSGIRTKKDSEEMPMLSRRSLTAAFSASSLGHRARRSCRRPEIPGAAHHADRAVGGRRRRRSRFPHPGVRPREGIRAARQRRQPYRRQRRHRPHRHHDRSARRLYLRRGHLRDRHVQDHRPCRHHARQLRHRLAHRHDPLGHQRQVRRSLQERGRRGGRHQGRAEGAAVGIRHRTGRRLASGRRRVSARPPALRPTRSNTSRARAALPHCRNWSQAS